MNGDRWAGLVALVLALAVGGAIVFAAADAFRQHGHIGQEEADLLVGLSGVAAGAVAVYLGSKSHGGPHGPG